jgi:hypothetical protein
MRRKALGLFWLGVLLSLAAGCSGKSSEPKKDSKKDEGEGLHSGTLFAPGKGQHTYHLELSKPAKDKPTYLYVLGEKADRHVPISTKTIEMEIKGDPSKIEFKAEPQEGDPEGKSSRFTAAAGKVPDKLDLSKLEFHAEIDKKQYHFVEDKD